MLKTCRLFLSLSLLAVLLAACQPTPATANPYVALTQAFGTALAQISQPTVTPALTETPTPAPTAIRTPPALPAIYQTTLLNPINIPRTYIKDSCQYLKAKWDPNNAAPGTVVMVIMFHSITKGAVEDANQIGVADFKKLMNDLFKAGFQAINMQQMADFMYKDAKIPARSVLLIVDDRHFAEYFNDHFRTYYDQWGWPVINGWISKFGGEDPVLQENVALSNQGWVDYQAHGVVHNINMSDSSPDDFITGELQGSITNIQKYFNTTPIAIIWPGGGFGNRPVQFARHFGYRLGFTVNPRGPVMFNWVPQADKFDPSNPVAIPEAPVNDPLMTLPRYWDADARTHLDTVIQIGDQATAYAQQNKATELEYYDIVCAPTYGPISAAP